MTPTTPPKRAALYARVSTQDQHAEAQLHALHAYTTARGLTALDFVDNGVSGAKDRRPALDRLLAACRRREVDLVLITKLDRLARSTRHLLNLSEEFKALGVGLVVLDQAIDTTTPAGELLFTVLGAIAQFERSLIVERTRAGLVAARRRGAKLGRPSVTDTRTRERIRRLRAAGHSLRAIAGQLDVSPMTVQRVVRSAT
jgi:DNA invertase Pin-like site-specific DNA recombinase